MKPTTISIEITNNCNNSCLICPHGHNLIIEKGYMPIDLFKLSLERIDGLKKGTVLELHGIGEPLLHPRINEFIEVAKRHDFFCSICTNAILLNEQMAKKIAESGLDKLVISLETKENYEKLRCTNIYDRVKDNVVRTAETHPGIRIEIYMIAVDDSDLGKFDEFKKQFKGVNMQFSQFRATDWCGTIPLEGLARKKGRFVRKEICPLFANYCSIDYNGNIRHCYLDYNSQKLYGNIAQNEFLDIWQSEKRSQVRRMMQKGEYEKIWPCRDCVFPFVDAEVDVEKVGITDEDLTRPEMQLLSKIKQN